MSNDQKLCVCCDRLATQERHGEPVCDKDAAISDEIDEHEDIAKQKAALQCAKKASMEVSRREMK